MGWFRNVVVGRWLARWLLRGSPWSIAAKLGLVALYGAWKWRRKAREIEESGGSLEIEADYEVLDADDAGSSGGGGGGGPPEEHPPGREGIGTDDAIDHSR